MAGVKVNFIHYKGTGAMMPDLLAGRIHSTSVSFLSSMPHIKAGKTIALGITTADRSPLWADLPTLDEQGVKGYDYGSWIGVFATGGTPSGTLARVHAELAKAGKAPEIRQKLEPDFVQIIVSSPEIFQRHVIEDIARWRELGKEVEIKVE